MSGSEQGTGFFVNLTSSVSGIIQNYRAIQSSPTTSKSFAILVDPAVYTLGVGLADAVRATPDEGQIFSSHVNYNLSASTTVPAPTIAKAPSSQFDIIFQALAGLTYQLQVSTDLRQWSDTGSPVVGDGTPKALREMRSGDKEFWRLAISNTPTNRPLLRR